MKKLLIISMLTTLICAYGNGLSHGSTINIVSITNQTNEEVVLYVYNRSQPLGTDVKQGALFISPDQKPTRAKLIQQPLVKLESSKVFDTTLNKTRQWFDVIGLSQVTKKYTYEEDVTKPELFLSFKTVPFAPNSTIVDIEEAVLKKASSLPRITTFKNLRNRDIIIGRLIIGKINNSLDCKVELSTDYEPFYKGDF